VWLQRAAEMFDVALLDKTLKAQLSLSQTPSGSFTF
jgi:hypothetical protein